MNGSSLQLYAQMQEEINQLEVYCKNEIVKVEGCFNIALFYWNKIKSYLESHIFRYETDEINFFKHVKPLFIAEIEYYTLYYQAALFKPADDKDQLLQYWMHQLRRVELFYNRHREFYHYYMNSQTHKDNIYFARSAETNTTHAYDHIAARILGYQKYRDYVEAELSVLMQEV